MTVEDAESTDNPLEDELLPIKEDDAPFPNLDSVLLDENQLDIVTKDGFKNVLIVEDDQYIAKEYGYMLAAYGFHVSYAFDSEQAVKAIYLYGGHFDFIILDIRMFYGRYLTAYDTAEGIRTGAILSQEMREYCQKSLIIALTNSTDAFDEAWFEANHRHHFCKKKEYTPVVFAKYLHMLSVEENTTTQMDEDLKVADGWETQLRDILDTRTNITIQFIEEQTMGDKYKAGQVGAQGKHAHAHDMVFNQIWEQNKANLDLRKLSMQLSELREAMAKEATKQQEYVEIGNVASAELEVSNGNGAKALEYLQKTGKWTMGVAEKIGVGVAIAAIKASLGI